MWGVDPRCLHFFAKAKMQSRRHGAQAQFDFTPPLRVEVWKVFPNVAGTIRQSNTDRICSLIKKRCLAEVCGISG